MCLICYEGHKYIHFFRNFQSFGIMYRFCGINKYI